MDNWVIVEIQDDDGSVAGWKVLAGWSGGYLDGNSWRMNSGIKDWYITPNTYIFEGYSGSEYICPKDREGIRMNIANVVKQLEDSGKAKIISMETFMENWV